MGGPSGKVPDGACLYVLTEAGRRRLSQHSVSQLPTQALLSVLMRGEAAKTMVKHPSAALTSALVAEPGAWVAEGSPWLYAKTKSAKRSRKGKGACTVEVTVGDASAGKGRR